MRFSKKVGFDMTQSLITVFLISVSLAIELVDVDVDEKSKHQPFEAVFQGLCENNELCEQLCFNLHDGTFECDCQPGFSLDTNGYSCSKQNMSHGEGSILYKKEASFVAVLEEDEDYQNDDSIKMEDTNDEDKKRFIKQLNGKSFGPDSSYHYYEDEELEGRNHNLLREWTNLSGERLLRSKLSMTSPEPNLEQKVPSQIPNIEATQSLTPTCRLDCDIGKCILDKHFGVPRCQCPLGRLGHECQKAPQITSGRFHGNSWAAFPPLREAYRDVQLSLEFRPYSPEGVLLLSGESDDLSGDFMAAVLKDGFVHFKWDCGSGAGSVMSPEKVELREWNRITVYRHRWDVWLLLNNGHHVQGRSEGLFSRITFREPLYVGGTFNMTSLTDRLGVNKGFEGCIRRLQVNDHVYKFHKQEFKDSKPSTADYAAVDGWDITECAGEICSEMECLHGGKCISSMNMLNGSTFPSSYSPSSASYTPKSVQESSSSTYQESHSGPPVCLCPLGYSGKNCEKQLNLEVPSFNGSSLLVFPPFGNSILSWVELELVFRTASTDGVLLYAGHRTDGTGDFLAVTLSQAHVLVTIDLGSGPLTLRSLYPIQPGLWHSVRISRTGRRTWIYIDDQLPVEGLTPGAFTMLTLAQPLFLGGIPNSIYPPPVLSEKSNFVGCIQKLSVGNQPIHLVSGAVSGTNVGSCDHPCSNHPCDNGGLCEPQMESYACKCPLGFNDDHCRSRVVTQVATPSFSGRSFLKYSEPEILKRVSGDKLHLWLRFRSMVQDGLILWIGSEEIPENDLIHTLSVPIVGDSLSLELKRGRVVLRFNLGSGFAYLSYNSSTNLDDGEWHSIKLTRFEREAQISVDDKEYEKVISPGDLIQLNVDSPLYLGGREAFRGIQTGYQTSGLNGCLADLTLATDYHVDLITQASAGQNIDYC